MRRTAYVASVILGVGLILGGIGTWIVVSTTLGDQSITVAEDAEASDGWPESDERRAIHPFVQCLVHPLGW